MKPVSFRIISTATPLPPALLNRLNHYPRLRLALEKIITGCPFTELKNISKIPRLSSLTIGMLINKLVADMPESYTYVNIGVWHGFSLLAGMSGNASKRCIGIDNFSEFGNPRDQFMQRLWQIKSESHEFFETDYEEYFRHNHKEPIGVYYYDGSHSYDHQLKGLELAEPFLSPDAYILVDDTNWPAPRQATMDFLTSRKNKYELVMDITTAGDRHPTYWNGLMVLQKNH